MINDRIIANRMILKAVSLILSASVIILGDMQIRGWKLEPITDPTYSILIVIGLVLVYFLFYDFLKEFDELKKIRRKNHE